MSQIGEEYDDIEWNHYADVMLLNALAGLRPVGINYPFCMMAVWNRFIHTMGKNVSLESIENRLSTFYDFEAANGIVDENLIFNHEQDFALPEHDFPEVTSISKERDSGSKKSSRSSSAENPKTPVSKSSKKPEPKTSEKKKIEDDKKTPAKKRGRASERSTPVAKRGRN
uniref:MRG-binding protein n=1 Tax=Lygus hesperus TaxID=30085 RepID=A0A0A9Z8T2_LYGHE